MQRRRQQHVEGWGGHSVGVHAAPAVAELAVGAFSDPILLQQPAQHTCTAGRRNQSSVSPRGDQREARGQISGPPVPCWLGPWHVPLAANPGLLRVRCCYLLPFHTKEWSLFHPTIITLLCTNSSANTSPQHTEPASVLLPKRTQTSALAQPSHMVAGSHCHWP